jgi:SPP1 gp7 family putative phage head morphogenesis protein
MDERIAEREAQGETPSQVTLWMRQRLESAISDIESELNAFSIEAQDITTAGQRKSASIANTETRSLLRGMYGSNAPKFKWVTLAKEQLEQFVGTTVNGSPLSTLFNTIPQAVINGLRNAISLGIVTGENPRTTARRIQDVSMVGYNRAETIARTEIIRTAREVQRELYQKNDNVVKYQRMATQDGRTCLGCLALSGDIYETSELMPSHPNCRCVMLPIPADMKDTSGIDSKVILAGLDEEEQLAIMGPVRYQRYLEGADLRSMVEVVNDPNWGPLVKVKRLDI